MIGILVCGDNHFIVRGPEPDRTDALALARQWTIIQIGQIGQAMPPSLRGWSIVTRALREDLAWAVVMPGDGKATPAVAKLLEELCAKGVQVRYVHER